MNRSEPFDDLALAATHRRVRALARRLVGDSHADDLVQDAFVAGARARRESLRDPFAWFTTTLRRLAQSHHRSGGHRRARELAAARPESTETSGELVVDRLDAIESLVREVRALDEPYRAVIDLHFFEELSVEEISARLGVPEDTVRTRLRRALTRLRERLERARRGERSVWVALILPLARDAGAGALLMKTHVKWILAAAVLLLGCGAWWFAHVSRTVVHPQSHVQAALVEPDQPLVAPGSDSARIPSLEPVTPAIPEPALASAPERSVTGIVIDIHDRPVGNLRIIAREHREGAALADYAARSDEEGRFHLRRPDGECVLDVDSPLWTTVLEPWLGVRSGNECVLVVAPRVPVAGRVVDPEGRPLTAAEIELAGPNLRFELLRDVSQSSDVVRRTHSDADGRFELPDAPDLWPGKIVTRRAGFARDDRELFEGQVGELTIVLRPRERDPRAIFGRVLAPNGEPVEGAHVRTGRSFGDTSTATNALGEFELLSHSPVTRLVALAPNYLPVERELDATALGKPIELRLERQSLSIEGRILDLDGRPCDGIEIENLDGEPIHDWSDGRGRFQHSVERVLASTSPGPSDVRTDANGRFELRGLLARAYRVRCFDPRTLESIVSEALDAGSTGVVLRLSKPEQTRSIAGRVVDRHGRPVADAEIRVLRPSQYEKNDPFVARDSLWLGAAQRTDSAGRFSLEGVSASSTRLWATPRRTRIATTLELDGAKDLLGLEVVVPLSCLVQIDLRGSGLGCSFASVVDPNSPHGFVTIPCGRTSSATGGVWIENGRSQAFVVSEQATAIALKLDRTTGEDPEYRLLPFTPDPDRLTVIRP